MGEKEIPKCQQYEGFGRLGGAWFAETHIKAAHSKQMTFT